MKTSVLSFSVPQRRIPLFILLAWFSMYGTYAGEVFVSPNGSASGDGTSARPLDLESALAGSSRIRAGDTVWLRGGTYRGKFTSMLTGTSSYPITVRSYPGEWARLDSGTSPTDRAEILSIQGRWTIYRDFEVMSSDPKRVSSYSGSYASDIKRGEGISMRGPNNKLINLIIHDAAQGIAVWSEAPDTEVYGCIIYYNGWQGPDRAHGHGIYSQNEVGYKVFRDNVIFNQFDKGIQVFGSDAAELRNFLIEGNTIFHNGILSKTRELAESITVYGGSTGPEGIVIRDNLFYGADFQGKLVIGGEGAKDLVFQGNYVPHLTRIRYWQSANVTGNTFLRTGSVIELYTTQDPRTLPYVWNQNTYFSQELRYTPFGTYQELSNGSTLGQGYIFDGWRQATGFDSSSVYRVARPSGAKISVRRNQYETGRGTITVYNWDLASSVRVDLGPVLLSGQSFEIRNAQNYFAGPIVSGVFDGAPVTLPTALGLVSPIGASTPAPTGPEFNVYIVRATGAAAPNNTPPTISSIGSQSTTMDTATAPIPFTVGDRETSAGNLAVLASSSNPTIVPSGNITVSGSGSDRSVTVKPAAGQTGTLTITLAVTDGTLLTSTSFTLTVSALSGQGGYAAPNGLSATPSDSRITLDWNSASGVSSYRVKRAKIDGGPYGVIETTGSSSYTDTGLVNGRTYYYVVSAVYSGVESPNSAQAGAIPGTSTSIISAPPASTSGSSAPENLTASPGSNRIALTWSALNGAGSYTVKRSKINGGPYSAIADVSSPSYTDTGLVTGRDYYYVVSANLSTGETANSSQAHATAQ